jgi:hypothetical protein
MKYFAHIFIVILIPSIHYQYTIYKIQYLLILNIIINKMANPMISQFTHLILGLLGHVLEFGDLSSQLENDGL